MSTPVIPTISQLDDALSYIDTMYGVMGNYSYMLLDKQRIENFIYSAKSNIEESGLTSFELSNPNQTTFMKITKTQAELSKNIISKMKNYFDFSLLSQPSTLIDTPYSTTTSINAADVEINSFLMGEINYVISDELGLNPIANGDYEMKISVDGNVIFEKTYNVGQESLSVKITLIKPVV
jgi:hypothetical protein